MTAAQRQYAALRQQSGLTYVEVMLATLIIGVALVPAIEALHTGVLGTEVYESTTADQYAALSKMEQVLAEPHSALISAAGIAGAPSIPSSYSDAPLSPRRSLVFLGLYDAEDNDGDGDPFTVTDPNLDADNNPFTNYTGLIWVGVEIEGSITHIESLSSP
ncbi:MAG: hypothetical protein KJO76_01695 [Gammaproteobacteria bacterium]|nr:hypothetical protein [Gammaproteobacteria bacterium]